MKGLFFGREQTGNAFEARASELLLLCLPFCVGAAGRFLFGLHTAAFSEAVCRFDSASFFSLMLRMGALPAAFLLLGGCVWGFAAIPALMCAFGFASAEIACAVLRSECAAAFPLFAWNAAVEAVCCFVLARDGMVCSVRLARSRFSSAEPARSVRLFRHAFFCFAALAFTAGITVLIFPSL